MATLLIVFARILMAPEIQSSTGLVAKGFAGKNWIFKRLKAENPYTVHYLATLYEGTQYRFNEDHSYTGNFFGLVISGTWDVSSDMLILNKGTNSEESYKFSFPSPENVILEATEKGNNVYLEFARHQAL